MCVLYLSSVFIYKFPLKIGEAAVSYWLTAAAANIRDLKRKKKKNPLLFDKRETFFLKKKEQKLKV